MPRLSHVLWTVVSISSLSASAAEDAPAPLHLTAPGLELIGVSGGTFRMGSDDKDPERFPSELKATVVTISQPFWLGKTEVTRSQWEAVMGPIAGPTFIGSPKDTKELAGDLPMADVTWGQAISFCDKLTQRERDAGRLKPGYVFSLPSEAQWEYACRAGSAGLVPASTTERDASIWYMKTAGPWTYSMGARLNPVGKKKANAWGFFDMLGNVREWVLDPAAPYSGGTATDPLPLKSVFPGKKQKEEIELRVMRGGCWIDGERGTRAAARDWADPAKYAAAPGKKPDGKPGSDFRGGTVGFRLALVPEKMRGAVEPLVRTLSAPPAAPANP
ncbi:formylglycine-generating enzyme family protein [Luteolibacter ambystomatis]|uniref:Formylglycine-generating enzyme family protein n=1 Tax=Luteolibacter ambystomatis TaxID=2824561 RepID=A0A975G5E5_9BACT|nr:formylglycine-generating enzyme family protein [Luteolibacter ambystomatis]QUE49647.1 formylglycine-generating enzyme family protein [Luteolibacter ambystomatis]